MENLQGGTLSLEHRYRIQARRDPRAFVTRYEGLQLPFDRPVWVKVYEALDEANAEPRVFERIKRSAHRAHQIEGPSILRLLDYGELDRGIPFVVSERIDGPSLRAHLDDAGPLPPNEAAELAERIGAALEVGHDLGLSHGTLAPHWIVLPDGAPSRARVGHARIGLTLDELRRMDGAVLTTDLIRAFPPETFQRDTIPPEELDDEYRPTDEFTVAADVWAMGTVLYESLVGFHPYFDDDEPTDPSDGIVRIQNESPRPLADFGIEAEIGEPIDRALATDPADRWDSISAFLEALRDARSATLDSGSLDRFAVEPKSKKKGAPSRETSAESPAPEDPSEGEPTKHPSDEELEPGGPASLLVTLALFVLFGSNVGWFIYYMRTQETPPRSEKTEQAPPVPESESYRIHSDPPEAVVYAEGRESPLGRTPLELPTEIAESPSVQLQLKKTGFVDQSLTLSRERAERKITVELHEQTSQ